MKLKKENEYNKYQLKNNYIKKVNFQFDDDDIFEGFTDGTLWNGWNQIFVNSDVFVMILESWAIERNICISELIQTDWFDNDCDLPLSTRYNTIDSQIVFDLNGFVTTIYKGLTENELMDLYQIQELMESDIFDVSPFEDEEENERYNNELYQSLVKAITIFENK